MSIYPNETPAAVEKAIEVEHLEAARRLKPYEQELETARKYNHQPERVKELETRLAKIQEFNETTMKGLNLRLKEAQARENGQLKKEEAVIAEHAAKEKTSMKETMRAAWVREGGNLEDFEKAWPDLYQAEMVQRTQATMSRAQQEDRARILRSL